MKKLRDLFLLLLCTLFTAQICAQSFEAVDGSPVANEAAIADDVDSSDGIWGDFDNDGDLDLYITNIKINDPINVRNFFYENRFFQFRRTLNITPVLDRRYSVYGNWVDYDNDLDLDLYISNGGEPSDNNLYKNKSPELSILDFQKVTGTPITDELFHSPDASWADYDNDGDMDVAMAIWNGRNFLFRNDGNDAFVDVTVEAGANGEPSGFVNSWKAAWGDYNNDGLIDMFFTNYDDDGGANNSLFRNLGNGKFQRVNPGGAISSDGGKSAKAEWGDYNNDGFLDLFVVNFDGRNFLYQNNGGTSFERINSGQLGSDDIDAFGCAWGDVNNDGFLDLFVANLDNTEEDVIYMNRGNGSFRRERDLFPGKILSSKNGTFGDMDNDGDLDLIILKSQNQNKLYRNTTGTPNTPPTAPGNLNSNVDGSDVFLSWGFASDEQQNRRSLSYDIWVWKKEDPSQIIAAPYALEDGQRKIARRGLIQGTEWFLKGLEEGEYCWKIQAVDHSFAGSPFSEENCFTIGCSNTASIITDDEQSICAPELKLQAKEIQEGVTGKWTASAADISFSPNENLPEVTANNIPEGEVFFIWTVSSPSCEPKSDTIRVEYIGATTKPVILTPDDQTVCLPNGFEVTANLPAAGETSSWSASSDQVTFSPDPNQNTVTINKLPIGSTLLKYTIATKFCNTADTASITVNYNGPVEINIDQLLPDTCETAKGRATVKVEGGSQPYELAWNTNPVQSSPTATGLVKGNYRVIAKDENGCGDTLGITIESVNLASNVELGNDTVLCEGESLVLDAGIADAAYSWSPGNQNTQTISVNTAGTYAVEVSLGPGCEGSDEIKIENAPPPLLDLGPDTTVCDKAPVVLDPNGANNLNYLWSTGETAPFIVVEEPGNYSVKATDPTTGCANEDNIAVNSAIAPNLFITADPTGICNGKPVTLSVPEAAGATYSWNTGQNGREITVDEAGEYRVKIISEDGCEAESSIKIEAQDLNISITPVEASIQPGDSVQLLVSGGETFVWNPSSGLSCTDCPDPLAKPSTTTTYNLVINEGDPCSVDTTIRIEVLRPNQALECTKLNFPNIFTPNGDGKNDRWVIQGLDQFPENSLQIYDRWGSEAYLVKPYANDWEGIGNEGKLLVPGTFYYILTLENSGEQASCYGEITLIR